MFVRDLRTIVALVVAAICASTGCRWREGHYVWETLFDGSPDGDAEPACDAEVEAGCVCPLVSEVDAEGLYGLIQAGEVGLEIVDIRPATDCDYARIPDARCIPWTEGTFAEPLDALDDARWLVLYDADDSIVRDAAEAIPPLCERRLSILRMGFVGWTAGTEYPIDN